MVDANELKDSNITALKAKMTSAFLINADLKSAFLFCSDLFVPKTIIASHQHFSIISAQKSRIKSKMQLKMALWMAFVMKRGHVIRMGTAGALARGKDGALRGRG